MSKRDLNKIKVGPGQAGRRSVGASSVTFELPDGRTATMWLENLHVDAIHAGDVIATNVNAGSIEVSNIEAESVLTDHIEADTGNITTLTSATFTVGDIIATGTTQTDQLDADIINARIVNTTEEVSAPKIKGDSSGKLEVSADITVTGSAVFEAEALFEDDARIEGDLSVEGDATIEGSLGVEGAASFEEDVLVTKDLNVGQDVDIQGDTLVGGKVEAEEGVFERVYTEELRNPEPWSNLIFGDGDVPEVTLQALYGQYQRLEYLAEEEEGTVGLVTEDSGDEYLSTQIQMIQAQQDHGIKDIDADGLYVVCLTTTNQLNSVGKVAIINVMRDDNDPAHLLEVDAFISENYVPKIVCDGQHIAFNYIGEDEKHRVLVVDYAGQTVLEYIAPVIQDMIDTPQRVDDFHIDGELLYVVSADFMDAVQTPPFVAYDLTSGTEVEITADPHVEDYAEVVTLKNRCYVWSRERLTVYHFEDTFMEGVKGYFMEEIEMAIDPSGMATDGRDLYFYSTTEVDGKKQSTIHKVSTEGNLIVENTTKVKGLWFNPLTSHFQVRGGATEVLRLAVTAEHVITIEEHLGGGAFNPGLGVVLVVRDKESLSVIPNGVSKYNVSPNAGVAFDGVSIYVEDDVGYLSKLKGPHGPRLFMRVPTDTRHRRYHKRVIPV